MSVEKFCLSCGHNLKSEKIDIYEKCPWCGVNLKQQVIVEQLLIRAREYAKSDDIETARQVYSQYLEYCPNDINVLIEVGHLYHDLAVKKQKLYNEVCSKMSNKKNINEFVQIRIDIYNAITQRDKYYNQAMQKCSVSQRLQVEEVIAQYKKHNI